MANTIIELPRPAEGQVLVGSSDRAEIARGRLDPAEIIAEVSVDTNEGEGFASMHEDLSTPAVLFGRDVGPMHTVGQALVLPNGGGDNWQSSSVEGMKKGNYRIIMGNIYPYMFQEGRAPTHEEYERAVMEHFDVYQDLARRYPDDIQLVGTQGELADSQDHGRIGMVISNEGIYLDPSRREESLNMAERMRKLGIVSFSFWNDPTALGSTQKDENEGNDIGLSDFGRDFFQVTTGLGGIVDASHASTKTTEDFLKEFEEVFASHSGVRGVNQHLRLLTPEHAREIVRRDGLVGINLHHGFVSPNPKEVRATVDHVVDRIIEAAGVVGGTRNLAIGTDFGGLGTATIIAGLEDSTTVSLELYSRLRARGFSKEEARGILYGNANRYLMRVLPKAA